MQDDEFMPHLVIALLARGDVDNAVKKAADITEQLCNVIGHPIPYSEINGICNGSQKQANCLRCGKILSMSVFPSGAGLTFHDRVAIRK